MDAQEIIIMADKDTTKKVFIGHSINVFPEITGETTSTDIRFGSHKLNLTIPVPKTDADAQASYNRDIKTLIAMGCIQAYYSVNILQGITTGTDADGKAVKITDNAEIIKNFEAEFGALDSDEMIRNVRSALQDAILKDRTRQPKAKKEITKEQAQAVLAAQTGISQAEIEEFIAMKKAMQSKG
jgi:hypothetical protein